MKIEAVDFFYLSMPQVRDIGDGSQDALVVRVRSGAHEGWGECEAAPLPSIAAFVCPMSHAVCKPVGASVVGQHLEGPDDIRRIGHLVRTASLDLLQADHTLSGVDMALWDLLGRQLGEPVWRLLGWKESHPKRPYASVLFGGHPQETLDKARRARRDGFSAAKFGWGPFGRDLLADEAQVRAAREGLDADAILLVDAGTVFGEDVEAAAARLPVLEECGAVWFEEPFPGGALEAYGALARRCRTVRLAGGEGSHNEHMGRHMVDHGGVGFVQIDAGRIGGITPAHGVALHADKRGVTFVNHTFTSHLALAASLQPFAGLARHELAEYPMEASLLAVGLTRERIQRNDGLVRAPEAPGLGISVAPETLRKYLVDCEIKVGGRVIYRTPEV